MAHLESKGLPSVKKKQTKKRQCGRQRGTVKGRNGKREAGFLKLGVIDSFGWQLLKVPETPAGRWAGGRSSKHMCHPKWVCHNDKEGRLEGVMAGAEERQCRKGWHDSKAEIVKKSPWWALPSKQPFQHTGGLNQGCKLDGRVRAWKSSWGKYTPSLRGVRSSEVSVGD